ncbi:hypothetical protein OIDMADRAFT_53093 [Oidiodendron maius Zn]|uniref:Uncharacterized protein n=1 Tax=Oidiodendron maius (strain Zn) TaxID=913774 RepID=A0A0C3H542_OIDMZ|nr:hypothetical protein OIDMADRAFT_53093 [Oidiodendron maius Zn]
MTLQGLQSLQDDQPLPPRKKVKRGRAKVARIRIKYKLEKQIKLCSICRQDEHNRRVCPKQPVEHERAQRARDQLVEDGEDSDTTSSTLSVINVASEVDHSNPPDEMFDTWWTNLQREQWVRDQGDRDQEAQGQEVQGQGAYWIHNQKARRYPLRTRQLTIKAAALGRE